MFIVEILKDKKCKFRGKFATDIQAKRWISECQTTGAWGPVGSYEIIGPFETTQSPMEKLQSDLTSKINYRIPYVLMEMYCGNQGPLNKLVEEYKELKKLNGVE